MHCTRVSLRLIYICSPIGKKHKVIIQAKKLNIVWFHFVMICYFSVWPDFKLTMFCFSTVNQTKQDIWSHFIGLLSAIFYTNWSNYQIIRRIRSSLILYHCKMRSFGLLGISKTKWTIWKYHLGYRGRYFHYISFDGFGYNKLTLCSVSSRRWTKTFCTQGEKQRNNPDKMSAS